MNCVASLPNVIGVVSRVVVTPRPFWKLWLLALAWALLFIGASVVFRLTQGKFIFRPDLPGATFTERWRSGRSLRNPMTRLAGASRCLWVTVTADSLLVGSHFPFSLMFMPEFYGLEHDVRLSDISGVEQRRGLFGRPSVVVRFRRAAMEDDALELELLDPEAFTAALGVTEPHQ